MWVIENIIPRKDLFFFIQTTEFNFMIFFLRTSHFQQPNPTVTALLADEFAFGIIQKIVKFLSLKYLTLKS